MEHINELSCEFVSFVAGRSGDLARVNNTFFSIQVVSEALEFIRRKACSGHALTPEGVRFVGGAASYLASLAFDSYRRRGLDCTTDVSWNPDTGEGAVGVIAQRLCLEPETYAHDFLRDTLEELIVPRRAFPSLKGRSYIVGSLRLPTPEYLYMAGVYLMLSPLGLGNWPEGETMLGTDEDFNAARQILVDDLHKDIGLPLEHPGYRALSHWVVFPLYGWELNDGQRYNMMTLVDQICFKKIVTEEEGVLYLRSLLRCQLHCMRNLAARTLMVLGDLPADPQETDLYFQALSASDTPEAVPVMNEFAARVHGDDFFSVAGVGDIEFWRMKLREAPAAEHLDRAIFEDPVYAEFGATDPAEGAKRLVLAQEVLSRFPDEWFAKVAFAASLVEVGQKEDGKALLQALVGDEAPHPIAHFTLGGCFLREGDYEGLDELYLEAVKRWPQDSNAVGNSFWSLTRKMVSDAPVETELSS